MSIKKCMSFTDNAHMLVSSKSILKACKDHDHAYISLEPSFEA